jgi:hypothetical protein
MRRNVNLEQISLGLNRVEFSTLCQ